MKILCQRLTPDNKRDHLSYIKKNYKVNFIYAKSNNYKLNYCLPENQLF